MATRTSNDEIVETFYGINRKTLEVESVSKTRGGKLSKWGKDAQLVTHHIEHGRDPKTEVVIVFGLTDVLSIPETAHDAEWAKKRIDELKSKAAEMKTAAAASGER